MRFDFSDTQYALRDLARDLFTRESPPSRVRALWDGKPFDRSVWTTMAEAGIVGVTVPEEFGGAGGTDVDLTLVYEEAGRAALPEPLVETASVAVPLIAELGSAEQRKRWLPAIAAGDVIAAVEDGPYVAWAAEADLLICLHRQRKGAELHALDRDHFEATPAPSIDRARPMATVEIDPVKTTRLARTDPLYRGWVGTAGLLNGIASRLLEMTLAHVKDRVQFGRPVGGFQAVKHKLATMHVALESSRPATWYAGYALAHNLADAWDAASVAVLAAADAESVCNRDALQCHGGIGFTWEHDLHLWLKRGIALRSAFGTLSAARDVPASVVADMARR